jgi:adenosylhomocysteinase
LKALLEGFRVMTMDEAAPLGDIFITATGMKDVIVDRHFRAMKDGAIVCNTGHYDCELNLPDLRALAASVRTIREDNEEVRLADGRRVYVLGQGRLVNLACAEGHPSEVMDMSFSNQALALCKMAKEHAGLANDVYTLPPETDQHIAEIKLRTMGVGIDTLTPEQIAYASDYSAGT